MKLQKFFCVWFLTILMLGIIGNWILQAQASNEPSTYALDFDGDNDTVKVTTVAGGVLDPDVLTVTAWFKTNTLIPTSAIFDRHLLATYAIYIALNNLVFMVDTTLAGGSKETIWSELDTDDIGEWIHVAGTYDNSTMRLYRNGTEVANTPQNKTVDDGLLNVTIGSESSPSDFFNGTIDEVCIYNRALNATEVNYSYNNGLGTYAPLNKTGLVAWWKFEGSGDYLYDRSGNGNHGTINGATWTTGKAPDWYSFDPFYFQPNYVATLSSLSYTLDRLTFTVSASSGSTSITKIYCPNQGRPKTVTGCDTWSFNGDTNICTIEHTHRSPATFIISWGTGASGKYKFQVNVIRNSLPVYNANVTVLGVTPETKSTNLLGIALFEVPYGFYTVSVTIGEETQTKEVLVSQDMAVGFEFKDAPSKGFGADLILVPVFIFVVAFVIFMFMRKR